MAILGLLGVALILFAILYLIFHFVRNLFSTKYFLSKKIFYPALIGGILLVIGALVVEDTGTAGKLEEANAKNTELRNEVTELKAEVEALTQKVTDAEKLNTDLEETKATVLSEKDSLTSEIIALEKEVARLTEENETVIAERDSLSKEVSSLSSAAASTVGSTPSELLDEPVSVPSSEYYDNCSAAQAAGAAPVRVGDPGYGSHLDRDGDGVGCEY